MAASQTNRQTDRQTDDLINKSKFSKCKYNGGKRVERQHRGTLKMQDKNAGQEFGGQLCRAENAGLENAGLEKKSYMKYK